VANRIVGLDIGHYSIKAVEIETGLRTWDVVAFHEEVIVRDVAVESAAAVDEAGPEAEVADADLEPETEDTGEHALDLFTRDALRRLLARQPLAADAWIVSLRRDDTYLTPLTLPFGNIKEVQPILLPQLDGRIPVEADEMFIDAMIGGPAPEGGFLVHTAALAPSLMAAFLSDLAAVGIDPRIVDVQPWSLCGAPGIQTDSTGPVAVLDIGAEKSSVVVVSGGRMEFARVVSTGGETLTRALATEFHLPEDRAREGKHREAAILAPLPAGATPADDAASVSESLRRALKPLVRAVRASLLAHSTAFREPVTALRVVGGSSVLPGLDTFLSAELGVPCSVVTIPVTGAAAAEFAPHVSRFALATALALRLTQQPVASRFNLRKGSFAWRGSFEFIQSQVPALLAAAAAFVLCLGAMYAGRLVLLNSEASRLDEALAEMTELTFGEPVTAVGEIRRRLSAVSNVPRLHPEKSAWWYFSEIANMLADLQDSGTDIEARELDMDLSRFTFSVQGVAESAEAVDNLMSELGTVACLSEIARNDLSVGTGDLLTFRVQGKIDCEANPDGMAADGDTETDEPDEEAAEDEAPARGDEPRGAANGGAR
jgi:general secretion pathway protein L